MAMSPGAHRKAHKKAQKALKLFQQVADTLAKHQPSKRSYKRKAKAEPLDPTVPAFAPVDTQSAEPTASA